MECMTTTSPQTVTVHDSDDIYMLYMSCLRVAFAPHAYGSLVVEMQELDLLLDAIEGLKLANAVRDIEQEISYLEGADTSGAEHWVMLRDQLMPLTAHPSLVESIEIPRQLWQRIILASTAYALGRRSYIVSWQAQIVGHSFQRGELDHTTVRWITTKIRELKSTADSAQQGYLGAAFDERTWTELHDKLNVPSSVRA